MTCCSRTARASCFCPLDQLCRTTPWMSSAELLRHPNTMSASDGGAHVGFISDGSFPTFLLTYWGKQRGH